MLDGDEDNPSAVLVSIVVEESGLLELLAASTSDEGEAVTVVVFVKTDVLAASESLELPSCLEEDVETAPESVVFDTTESVVFEASEELEVFWVSVTVRVV